MSTSNMAPPGSMPPPGRKTTTKTSNVLTPTEGVNVTAHKVVVYGSGGIGKSELCANVKKLGLKPLFLDLDDETKFLDVKRYTLSSFDECRAVLHDPNAWEGIDVGVVDSLTMAEAFSGTWTLGNVKHEKGHSVDSIEGYGFGKGYSHVFDTFMLLLGDLDALARRGIHILCTAHDCTEKTPNPTGEDYLQYQPRLQSPPKNGKIRERVKEWCDHMLFIDYDRNVEDGKATGAGSRTIYTAGSPTCWAKSRMGIGSMEYKQGSADIWEKLFRKV